MKEKTLAEEICSLAESRDGFAQKLAAAFLQGLVSKDVLMECIQQNYGKKLASLELESQREVPEKRNKRQMVQETEMISVIIPTYNRIAYIEKAVDSVLDQSYGNFEIIVLDDSSNDGTKELFHRKYGKEKRVRYLCTKQFRNILPGQKRKIGYDKSRGDYVIFLDSDDYYLDRDFFQKALAVFREHSEYSMVGSNAVVFNEDAQRYQFFELNVHGERDAALYLQNFQLVLNKPLSQFTTVFRKKNLAEAGMEEVRLLEDTIIYMRALLAGDAYIMEDVIGAYRTHTGSWSSSIHTGYLLQVLDEKRAVKRRAEKRWPDYDWNRWLYQQADYTIKFVTKSLRVPLPDKLKIRSWVMMNCMRFYYFT